MTLFRRLVLLVAALTCLSATALAAEVKTFAVAPFTVHGPEKYQYLSQGVQSMLESRMNWPGHLAPMDKAKAGAKLAKAPASEAEAKKTAAELGVDFLAYGSVTISGEQASVDIMVVGRDGKKWPKSLSAKIADLIPAMERTAQALNNEIFQRAPQAASGSQGGAPNSQLNSDFVVNQTGADGQKAYLNPSFRYAGPTETAGVWRSQSMPLVSRGIAIADFNGDGKAEIIVSASYFKEPRSFILSLEGNQLKELYKDIKLYMNVAQVPPDYSRQLVGSKGETKELFVPGVHNVIFAGGQPQLSTRLPLPSKANPFNFAYLPEKSGYKVIINDDQDRIVVYTAKGERIAATEEQYCGSAIGLEYDPLMAPMEKPKTDHLWTYYYIPLPMIVANLDKDDRYEVLVSKNISLAAQFFETFRTFSQGEIHALYWDGVGMNLLWKTRRIKGTVTGYALADIDNDGQKEMVVCLNTWPGAAGVYARRTIVLAYKLDASGFSQPGEFGIDKEAGE